MIEAGFSNQSENLEPIKIGSVHTSEPDHVVVITQDGNPIIELWFYLKDETNCFKDIKISNQYVVIGCGHKVSFVNIISKEVITHDLKRSYFGHLYPVYDIESKFFDKQIIVASSNCLYLYTEQGSLVWSSVELGVDGVVVSNISNGIISGSGECDPPGGWIDFMLELKSGNVI